MIRFDGRPNWFAALGRDAGRLARQALAAIPNDTVTAAAEVRARRIRARDALAQAHARLWTSDADTFDSSHALPRTLRVVELPR